MAHAELEALLAGGEPLWARYRDAVLLTTMEPCPLCLGAAVMADVPHIVFASHDAIVHSQRTIEANPYVRRHIRTYLGGVLEAESRALVGRCEPELLEYVVHGRDGPRPPATEAGGADGDGDAAGHVGPYGRRPLVLDHHVGVG